MEFVFGLDDNDVLYLVIALMRTFFMMEFTNVMKHVYMFIHAFTYTNYLISLYPTFFTSKSKF